MFCIFKQIFGTFQFNFFIQAEYGIDYDVIFPLDLLFSNLFDFPIKMKKFLKRLINCCLCHFLLQFLYSSRGDFAPFAMKIYVNEGFQLFFLLGIPIVCFY